MSRWHKPVNLSGDTVVPAVITLLTYACAFFFLLASFFTVYTMADNIGDRGCQMAWFSRAMDESSPVPFLLATFIIAFFLLDGWLSRQRRPVGSPAAWFGSSDLFLTSTLAVLAVLGAFWLSNGSDVLAGPSQKITCAHVSVTLILAAMLAVGFLLGVAARLWPRFFRTPCVVVPIIGLVILGFLVRAIESNFGYDCFPVSWPKISRLAVALVLFLIPTAILMGLEKRVCRTTSRATGLLCAGFWALFACAGVGILVPFMYLTSRMGDPERDAAQLTASLLIAAAFALAVVLRLLLHKWRSSSKGTHS